MHYKCLYLMALKPLFCSQETSVSFNQPQIMAMSSCAGFNWVYFISLFSNTSRFMLEIANLRPGSGHCLLKAESHLEEHRLSPERITEDYRQMPTTNRDPISYCRCFHHSGADVTFQVNISHAPLLLFPPSPPTFFLNIQHKRVTDWSNLTMWAPSSNYRRAIADLRRCVCASASVRGGGVVWEAAETINSRSRRQDQETPQQHGR